MGISGSDGQCKEGIGGTQEQGIWDMHCSSIILRNVNVARCRDSENVFKVKECT